MKHNMIKNIGVIIVLLLSLSTSAIGKQNTLTKNFVAANVGKSDMVKLIDIAGRQRMLSQRIAKDYMYIGNKTAVMKANRQLEISLKEFKLAHIRLTNSINNEEIKNMLDFVSISTEDFEALSKEEFSLDNAQLILDLSESMLEGNQYVVTALREMLSVTASKIVDVSGKQRMLSQRMAKYYIAYQLGIKDKNTVEQMNIAVKLFTDTHQMLMSNKINTPEINRKLNEIERLWKIVHKFYLNIEKGGLPLIVFNTTDKITTKMNEITKLYVKVYK